MTDDAADVIVVGGGAAGATAARTLLTEGDADRILLISAEDAAPYDRTTLSKSALTGAGEPPRLYERDLDDERLEVRRSTTARALDLAGRRVTLSDGTSLRYDRLLLAGGAAPRRLPLPGTELAGVHLVRELADTPALRRAVTGGGRLVVIGGGLIGLEVAAAARSCGTGVTVLEVGDRLMGRVLPPAIASIVADEHVARGVHVELGVRPDALLAEPDGRVAGVSLEDGRTIAADDVVIAVGVSPRTELAAAAGLAVDDGVVVDTCLRTSDPHVLAAGDLVRIRDDDGSLRPRSEAWTPALAMGQHAARVMLGGDAPYRELPTMWSDQYELKVQAAGTPADAETSVLRGSFDEPDGLAVFGLAGGRVRSVVGVSRGNRIGRTVRAGQLLIQNGTEVDADQLADPATDLRRLASGR